VLWQNGIASNIFVEKRDDYTANIRNIIYTITAPNGRSCTYSTKIGPSWEGDRFNIDDRVFINENTNTIGFNETPCIRFNCPDGIPSNNDVFEYTVTALVTFNSDKQMSVTGKVIVMNDTSPVVSRL